MTPNYNYRNYESHDNGVLLNAGDKAADENELHQLAAARNKISRPYRFTSSTPNLEPAPKDVDIKPSEIPARRYEPARNHRLPLYRQQLRKNALGIIHGVDPVKPAEGHLKPVDRPKPVEEEEPTLNDAKRIFDLDYGELTKQ